MSSVFIIITELLEDDIHAYGSCKLMVLLVFLILSEKGGKINHVVKFKQFMVQGRFIFYMNFYRKSVQ